MSKRPTNPDGTPWWVSSGPPTPGKPSVAEQIQEPVAEDFSSNYEPPKTHEESQSEMPSAAWFGISPEQQSAAIATGLGFITAVADLVSKPLSGNQQTSTHNVETCGVCPLCVTVGAIREHDAGLADLVESAMSGVTGSMEKLTGMLPDVSDRITEAVVSAAVKTLLNRN